jgi:hypothetical protein
MLFESGIEQTRGGSRRSQTKTIRIGSYLTDYQEADDAGGNFPNTGGSNLAVV